MSKCLELPPGWTTTAIREIAASMKNGIYKSRDAYHDDGVPCLRMYNIDDGRLHWRDLKLMRLTDAELEDYRLIPGDLLVNRVNSRELVGKACVIAEGTPTCVFESKNIRLRVSQEVVDPRYVNYRLLLTGRSYFAKNAQQTVAWRPFRRISWAD
jgi:type I restriction enzyme S subunit